MTNFSRCIFVLSLSLAALPVGAADVRQSFLAEKQSTVIEPAQEAHVLSEDHRDFRLPASRAVWFVAESPKDVVLLPEQELALREADLVASRAREAAIDAARPRSVVFFAFNKDKPLKVDPLVPLVKPASSPGALIKVAGHADEAGSDEYNQKLSERRAESVAQAFVRAGVPKDRLVTEGHGKTRPVSSVAAENRRVEAVLYLGEGEAK